MQCREIISGYLANLGGDFVCQERENRLWVISPYSYPDGDLIEVVIVEGRNERVKVSDFGETIRHLADLGFDPRGTKKGQYLLEDILKRFDIEIERGQIQKRASKHALGQIMFDVICACLAVAGLSYLSRAYQPATFEQEVAHYLTEHKVIFENKLTVTGSTGKRYKVDFYLPHIDGREGMMQALSPKSIQGVKRVVDSTFRLWSDLGNNRWFGTLMDDRIIKWKSEDIELLKRVSKVHFWQQRDDLLKDIVSH